MRKNKMMRLASILLVCVLMTTSVISGTFAKYTTQDSASDVARVAKWGVELQVAGNLFGDAYTTAGHITSGDEFTVKSFTSTDGVLDDVVAPGTKNDNGMTFTLEGKPEVDGVVTTEMKVQNVFLTMGHYGVMVPVAEKVVTSDNIHEYDGLYYWDYNNSKFVQTEVWEDGYNYYTLEDEVEFWSADYYPVVFKLTGATSEDWGTNGNDSLGRVAAAIAKQLNLQVNTDGKYEADIAKKITVYTGEKTFQTNDNLADWAVVGEKLTWAWDFGAVDKVGDEAEWTDKADTILGMLLASRQENYGTEYKVVKMDTTDGFYKIPVEHKDYCLDTQFSLDITVTQVD